MRKRLLILMLPALAGCGGGLPDDSSEEYREAVSAFFVGVAAMEVGEDLRAEAKLRRVTELAPEEPAAWANLGLRAMRRGEYEEAAALLETARQLAPFDSRVLYLSAQLEWLRSDADAAIAHLRLAAESDTTDLRAAWLLAEELEMAAGDGAEITRLRHRIAAAAPDNVAVLVSRLRRGEEPGPILARLARLSAAWGPDAREQLAAVAAVQDNAEAVATQGAFLRNVLLSEPAFRRDLATLQVPREIIGRPLTEFVRLAAPRSAPAPPDDSLAFAPERLLPEGVPPADWIGAVALGNAGLPAVFFADADTIRTLRGETWAFPGAGAAPAPHAVVGMDYDFDFRADIVMAGAGGVRILWQDSTEAFHDMTASLGLPAAVRDARYTGAWAADLDLEGDVDLVLAAGDGPVRVLRNNGDGTFAPDDLFADVSDLRNFVWADLDGDGDPDPVFLRADGTLRVMKNERQGRFTPFEMPEGRALDLAVTDSDSDGVLDLLALRPDGQVVRMSWADPDWTAEPIAAWGDGAPDASVRLFAADFDNNGGVDLLASGRDGSRVWLQDAAFAFGALRVEVDARVFAVASIRSAGQLDLVGLDGEGQPSRLAALTVKGYHWKQIHPRAAQAVGDQRINSFGIGGEVELRSGTLYQKRPIDQPILHFGLGSELLADVARITWPNGTVQAEFDLLSDQVISAQQRLKGSCPWVFTFDGEEMTFVTDFIWRSPLGLRINAQETAGIMTTEDWVRIRGDQMLPRGGAYDVRITAELWETHFFDHVSLLVVDHPVGTEIFVDERFAFPPPELAVHVTSKTRPVKWALDDAGRDVSDVVRSRDEWYLDFFGRGDYQGITRDHYVEMELASDMPDAAFLVAAGWIRPTDSSINVAISQGAHAPPRGLRMDVQNADGTWHTVHENLGFPSGKAKTVLIDLEGAFRARAPRRLRLHTNLEIYWDALSWVEKKDASLARIEHLEPQVADLRYRGYSVVDEADTSSPEVPDYGDLMTGVPIWRDLVGYYTRFGDVRELLAGVDDRYVIMNAGDEMALEFAEAPPPPDGMQRDFVLVGDGWVKDGDYNTAFSTTVRPLPEHAVASYDREPGALGQDPVFRRHRTDWLTYHTRYVVPRHFGRGISLRE